LGVIYQIKEDELGGECECMGEVRNAYKVLVGKPKGKRPLRRPGSRWETPIGNIISKWIKGK
jgi:hypothetical protein